MSEETLLLSSEKEQARELKMYEHIIACANDAIAILTPDFKYYRQNQSNRDLLGYNDQELLKMSPENIWGMEIIECIRDQQCFQGEVTCQTKTGDLVIVELSAFEVLDDEGEVLCYVGIKRDRTKRKQIENEVKQKQELIRKIIDIVPHYIFWKDRDSVYIGANQRFIEDIGLKNLNELVGKTDFDLYLTKEEADFFRSTDRQVMETRKPVLNLEETEITEDGHQRILLSNKVPIIGNNDQVDGVLGIYADVTNLRQAEKRLFESYKYLGVINRQVSILLDLNKQNRYQNETDLANYIMRSAINLTQAHGVLLYKFFKDENLFRVISQQGINNKLRSVMEKLVVEKYFFLQELTYQKNRVQGEAADFDLYNMTGLNKREQFLALPLLFGRELKGMVMLVFAQENELTTQTLDFGDALAMQATVALFNVEVI